MKTLFIPIIVLFISHWINAQNCSQNLVDATRAYYNGQFREVETPLEGCLDQLSKEEQVEAYKLLTDTYLVLGEVNVADTYISELLSVDPTFEPRQSDLVEFRNLFDTYEIVSRYAFGLTGGIMRPDYRIIKHQSIAGRTEEPDDYQENIGYFFGLTGEVPLRYNFYLNGAVMFEQRGFEQKETILELQRIKSSEREYRLNLPLQLKYIYPAGKYRLFVGGGYSWHYLLRTEGDLERFALEPEIEGTPIGVPFSSDGYDLTDLKRRSTFNWLSSVGVQAPLRGGFLLEFKATYERGFHNLIEEEKRFSDTRLVEDFAYVPDDVKVNAWMFGLTLMRHFTKPRKR